MMTIDNLPKISVYLTDDNFLASISISSDFDCNTINEHIMTALSTANVTYGINLPLIHKICCDGHAVTNIIIAEGCKPIDGIDAKDSFFFDTDHHITPKTNEDGSVNYKDLGFVESFNTNDLLFRKTPHTLGSEGTNVKGETVSPVHGQASSIKAGKNCTLSEDTLKIYAATNGIIIFENNTISISPVLEINDDIGTATGDISFNGEVKVHGNINSGMFVKCNKLEVDGVVENAKLVISGDLSIKSGIQGSGDSNITCLGDLTCGYITNANVYSQGSIHSDTIINSFIRCDQHLIIQGKKGHIIGGKAVVRGRVDAQLVGSKLGVSTLFILGDVSVLQASIKELEVSIKEYEDKLFKIDQCLTMLKEKLRISPLHQKYKALNAEYTRTKFTLQHDLQKKNQALLRLHNKFTESSLTEFSAKEVFPGTHINIGNNHIDITTPTTSYIVKSIRGELITQD